MQISAGYLRRSACHDDTQQQQQHSYLIPTSNTHFISAKGAARWDNLD
jgi:hypothetical protein